MIRIKDHKTNYIFDPWGYLGPKRRKLLEDSWAGLFRQEILNELPVNEITSAFSDFSGRPTKELYMALGSLVLQQMQNLTDEETSNQVAFNLQWQYALDITGESDEAAYLCPRTLWSLRQLVTEKDLDTVLFEKITARLARIFKVDMSQQRLDSVHIRSNMRHLGRIGIVVQAIHKFLVNLKRQHPDLWGTLPADLIERYLPEKALGCFSMVKPSESEKTLNTVCQDLFRLIQSLAGQDEVLSMSSFQLLHRVFKEQCAIKETSSDPVEISIKPAREVGVDSLQNPSDPEAGYDGHKGQGYQAQVMETYSEQGALSLITYAEAEPASVHDTHALIPALEAVQGRELKPDQVLADSAYGGEENREQAQTMGVEVIAPVMGSPAEGQLSLMDFTFSDQGEVLSCPAGRPPIKTWLKKDRHRAFFAIDHCEPCPLRDRCPSQPGKGHHYLGYYHKAFRLARRRQWQQTEAFTQRYRYRAGIEGGFSALDRKTGIKHLRVRGYKAVRYCVHLKAAGMNIFRASAIQMRKKVKRRAQKANSACRNLGHLFFKELLGNILSFPRTFWSPGADNYPNCLKLAA
jgi:Transposase DDE domain/Transposase domain (DUF772)